MEKEGLVAVGWDAMLVRSTHQRLPGDSRQQRILPIRDEQAPTAERTCQLLNIQAKDIAPPPDPQSQRTEFKMKLHHLGRSTDLALLLKTWIPI